MFSCSSDFLQVETVSLSSRPGLIIVMTPVIFKVLNRVGACSCQLLSLEH